MTTDSATVSDASVKNSLGSQLAAVVVRMIHACALLIEHTVYVLLLLSLVWVVEHFYRFLGLSLNVPIPSIGLVTFEQGLALFDYTIIVLIYTFAFVHIAGALHGQEIQLRFLNILFAKSERS